MTTNTVAGIKAGLAAGNISRATAVTLLDGLGLTGREINSIVGGVVDLGVSTVGAVVGGGLGLIADLLWV